MSKPEARTDEAEEEAANSPPPSSSRWLSRHGSLRQAAGQLSRRLAARLSLTRQRSLGGAPIGGRSATDEDADGDPYEDAGSPRAAAAARPQASPARFSLPKATSSHDGFLLRGRLLSTRHQRSCDSHDESLASAASGAGSSRCSSGDFGAAATTAWAGAGATKMDMMNFGRKSDEPGDDDKKDDASIKGLWKRAFNTLRIRDKEKTPKKKKGGKDEDDVADDVDPVYSLLKRAADKGVQKCTGCTPDSGGGSPLSAVLQASGKSEAAAASPCQEVPQCRGADCPCLCHNPLQLLVPSITLNDLKPRPKLRKGKSRSKSLAQAPPQSPQSPQSAPPAAFGTTSSAAELDGAAAAACGSRGRMASLRESASGSRRHQQQQE